MKSVSTLFASHVPCCRRGNAASGKQGERAQRNHPSGTAPGLFPAYPAHGASCSHVSQSGRTVQKHARARSRHSGTAAVPECAENLSSPHPRKPWGSGKPAKNKIYVKETENYGYLTHLEKPPPGKEKKTGGRVGRETLSQNRLRKRYMQNKGSGIGILVPAYLAM